MSKINLEPLADYLVVSPVEKEVTEGGVFLPETARKQPQKGLVLATGLGRWDERGKRVPMSIKAGNLILFARYAGVEVKLDDGSKVLILREGDVLAKIVNKKKNND